MLPVWSAWQALDQAAEYSGAAVYKIRLCRNSGPAVIPRFLSVDVTGLLSIGKTINMEKRRRQFLRGVLTGRGHSEANLLYILRQHSSLATTYPDHHYEYTFVRISQAGQESAIEEAEIKAYVREFEEIPPLNSAIPDRYGAWHILE